MSIFKCFQKKEPPFKGCFETQQGGRSENQDYVDFCDTDFGRLIVVCDGMGGGPGGSIASADATRTIISAVKNTPIGTSDKKQILTTAIIAANQRLRELQAEDNQLRGMGTTCVCVLIDAFSACVAHVGDSRLYQLRYGKKHWRTWDHSVLLDRIKERYGRTIGSDIEEAVEKARTSEDSHIISRALGTSEAVEVEIKELAYESGDIFAICTDGVWGAMPEEELITLLNAKEVGGALSQTLSRVQELGQSKGGFHDNYTLALLQTMNNSKLNEPMTHKARLIIYILSVVCILSILLSLYLGFRPKESTEPEEDISIHVSDSILQDSIKQLRMEIADRDSIITILQDSVRTNK